MASPLFVARTGFETATPLTHGGASLLRRHAEIVALLQDRGAGAAARLFAEPVIGEQAVTWYTEGSGEAEPFAALPAARRQQAEALLRAAIAELLPLLEDPAAAPLLRPALALGTDDAFFLVGERVVMAGWGMLPAGTPQAPATIAERVRGMFARYSPALAAIGPDWLEPKPAAPPAPPPAAGSVPLAAPAAGGFALPAARPGGLAAVWLVPLALLVAALFLALGAWLAWLHLARGAAEPRRVSLLDEGRAAEALRLQEETNRALEAELERARRAAQAPNVCTAEGPLILPPAPERQPVPPAAVPPAVPEQRAAPPASPGQPAQPAAPSQPFTGSLAQLLERAVVMVVAAGPGGIGHGSGFFVSGDTVMTNAHVVEQAAPDQVFIASAPLGRAIPARVIARTEGAGGRPIQPGEPDFALLRLAEPVAGAQPLALTRAAERLTDVVAAGYPAAVVQVEQGMQELRQGRLTTPPEIVLTRGTISTFQTLPGGLVVVPHTADMSPGNSGGPLVDLCGRVVGINTFISRATAVADRIKYAQKADAALAWLAQAGAVQVAEREGACVPQIPGLPAMPPGAAPGATPPGAPPASPAPGPSPAAPAAPQR